MKTFKLLFITVIFSGFLFTVKAQVVTGGNIGVDYRDDGYYIEIAPQIGYKYSIFESGAAPFVSYKENSDYLTFGLQIYTQATIYKGVFVHGELQAANVYVSSESERQWVLGLPVGVGYQYEIGKNIWAKGSILYDFLYKDGYSPQKNPIIRFGISYTP